MKLNKKEQILNISPIDYAKIELANFIAPAKTLTINMGGGESQDIIRNEPEGYRLSSYRSAQDKREPDIDELKLRVELAYLNGYMEILKEYIKKLHKEAYDLKPEFTITNLHL